MPVQTVERVRKREGALKRKLRESGGTLDGAKLRRLKKRVRRAQRKRRRLEGPARPKAEKPAS